MPRVITHSWIEPSEDEIDDEIEQKHSRRDDDDRAHDQRVIAAERAIDEIPAHAWNPENGLDHNRPGEHIGGGEAKIRDNRCKCGAKSMNVNVIARHSESPQRPDVRHRKRIAERRLHQPRHDGDLRQGERYHWQDLVLPRAIVPAADRQGMESQTKSKLQERPDDKDRQNDSEYRRAIDNARANRALAHRAS